MTEMPLVSIIMPVYQVGEYIKQSVKSVVWQTYSNIELILVDDGSPDDSISNAEKALKGKNFSYRVIRRKNGGLGAARNTGLKNAKGEWVYFLDSDDQITPSTIARMVSVADEETDLVFCDFHKVYSLGNYVPDCPKTEPRGYSAEELRREFLLRQRIVLAPGTLFRRVMLEKHGLLFEEIPWSEDQHFIWRTLLYIRKGVYLGEKLYQYFQHAGSIMAASRTDAMIRSFPAFLEVQKLYEKEPPVGKYLAARWVLGTLNSAANLSDWAEWQGLFAAIDGKKQLKKLLQFPDPKVRVSAAAALIVPKIYYGVAKGKRS